MAQSLYLNPIELSRDHHDLTTVQRGRNRNLIFRKWYEFTSKIEINILEKRVNHAPGAFNCPQDKKIFRKISIYILIDFWEVYLLIYYNKYIYIL